MQKITGIGGLFFRSKDPEALGAWYEKNFGINAMTMDPNCKVWEQQAGVTVFTPFEVNSDYYPMEQQFMVNFRVENMELMLEQLKANDVKIDENKMEDSIGKFAWVYDPEGRKIELWEPAK